MARMRSLRPDYFLREDMADVSLAAHFLLAGLQVLADRDGRLLDRPRTIKAQVFPFREVDIEAAMGELVRARAVSRYEVDGRRIIALLTWEDDQSPHPKETSAELPPPPVQPQRPIAAVDHASGNVVDASGRELVGLGVGIGCGSGMGVGSSAAEAPGAQAPLNVVPEDKAAGKPKAPRKQPDSEHHALWRALEAEYQRAMGHAYASGNAGADASAVKWLREGAKATPEEAVRRWGNLLTASRGGFPTVTGFRSLQQHWNTAEATGSRGGRAVDGVGRVEDVDGECSGCGARGREATGYLSSVGRSGEGLRIGARCGCWHQWEADGVEYAQAGEWVRARRAKRGAA